MASVDKITIDGTNYDIDATTVSGHTVATDVPSGAVFTDKYVDQTPITNETGSYRVMLSKSANGNTDNGILRKSDELIYEPSLHKLIIGSAESPVAGERTLSVGTACNPLGGNSVTIGNGCSTGLATNNTLVVGQKIHTVASNQLVIGAYNDYSDSGSEYAFIIGNGTDENNRSNSLTVTKNGSIWSGGNITASGTVTANNIATTNVTANEFNRLAGVTNNIQTQLNGKQGTITGAVSTVTDNNLTASMAMVTSATGKVDTSSVTAVELNRLSGVTNNVQTQLDGKISPGNLNTYVFTRDFTVSAKTVSAGGAASYTKTDSVPATGERILGVVGYEVTGTNRTRAGIYKTSVTQAGGFEVGIYNPNSSDQSWGLTVTCLYLKVSSS